LTFIFVFQNHTAFCTLKINIDKLEISLSKWNFVSKCWKLPMLRLIK